MTRKKKRIAFCGTRGLPANYGGFETAVDEITKRFIENDYECDVFCRTSSIDNKNHLMEFEGRKLIYVKGSKKKKLDTFISSIQTGFYLLRHRNEYDYVFWFNNANILGIILSLFTRIPMSINTDGLEWRRAKWSLPFKAFYFLSSLVISLLCKSLISDSKAIQQYYKKHFLKDTTFIAYGAPETLLVDPNKEEKILQRYNLERNKYFLQITRFEPDNLPLEIATQFVEFYKANKDFRFIIVGYKDPTPYSLKIKELSGKNGVLVLNSIYDKEILTVLRENAFCYIHGNSVGGTNPALLEAMKSCKRVMAIDGPFSREVLGEEGVFFNPKDMIKSFNKVLNTKKNSVNMKKRLEKNYTWDDVAQRYQKLVELRSK